MLLYVNYTDINNRLVKNFILFDNLSEPYAKYLLKKEFTDVLK